MKLKLYLLSACLCSLAGQVRAQFLVVEPDHYTNGAVLNHVLPEVSLITAANNNLPHPPVPFSVLATTTTFPFLPPTGTNVFAQEPGIPFWYTDRRLRMDFAGVISTLSIDFQGGSGGSLERGTLEVYNAQNVLLGSYMTAALAGGQIETMSISRAFPDISYAIAYTLPGGQTQFGRLDHLVFSVPVPEPSAFYLFGIGLLGILAWRSRARWRR